MPNPTAEFSRTLIPQLPLLVIYLVGMGICAMRWNKNPRPAQLAFLGTAFLVIDFFVQPAVRIFMIARLMPSDAADMTSMLALIGAVMRLTGYGFLLGAIFISRPTPIPRSSLSDQIPS
jgi:hypothetical protein